MCDLSSSILQPENWMVKVGDLTDDAGGVPQAWQVLTECGLDLADDFRTAIMYSCKESSRVVWTLDQDEEKAVERVNFHYMLMDGKHELAYAGPWEDRKLTFQFGLRVNKGCWVNFIEQEQEVMNFFFNNTKYTSFILRSYKPGFNSAYNYLVDLKWKVQTNLSTGRKRKILEKWMKVKKGQGDPVLSPLTNEKLTSKMKKRRSS